MLDHELEFTIASAEPTSCRAPTSPLLLHRGHFHGLAQRARRSDLTGRRRSRRRARPRQGTAGFDDPSRAVVGMFIMESAVEGMVTRAIGGAERDYLLVAYRGESRLYIPSDQIHVLRPYSGGEAPSLHRLGGSDFARKSRVRFSARDRPRTCCSLPAAREHTWAFLCSRHTMESEMRRIRVCRDPRPANCDR